MLPLTSLNMLIYKQFIKIWPYLLQAILFISTNIFVKYIIVNAKHWMLFKCLLLSGKSRRSFLTIFIILLYNSDTKFQEYKCAKEISGNIQIISHG